VRAASAAAVLAVLACAACGSAPERDLPPPAAGAPPTVSARAADSLTAVLDTRARRLDLRDAGGRTVAHAAAGVGPTGLACLVRGRWCWVVDTRGEALLVFRVGDRDVELTRRLYLPGDPQGISVDRARGRLRVTLTARHEVVELLAHGRPHVVARIREP
jgi:hypothetical protein